VEKYQSWGKKGTLKTVEKNTRPEIIDRPTKIDRPTRRGGGVALYVREQVECIELGLGANEEQVESLN